MMRTFLIACFLIAGAAASRAAETLDVSPRMRKLAAEAGFAPAAEPTAPAAAGQGTVFAPIADRPRLVERVAPFQEWPTLGSHAAGLLVEREIAGVCQIDWAQAVHQLVPAPGFRCVGGPDNTYRFSVDGLSPIAVYFQSNGEGFNFLRDWQLPRFRGDAAQFSRETPNRWGLHDEAHLAKVEVNGGKGSEPNVHFVVTEAAVLDGSAGHELKPAERLRGFLAPYGDLQSETSKSIDARLAKVVGTLESHHPRFPDVRGLPRDARTLGGFYATWQEREQALIVTYYRRVEDRFTKEELERRLVPHCPRGVLCMPPPPPRRIVKTWTFGAEFAVQASFNRHGAPLGVVESPVATFFTEPK